MLRVLHQHEVVDPRYKGEKPEGPINAWEGIDDQQVYPNYSRKVWLPIHRLCVLLGYHLNECATTAACVDNQGVLQKDDGMQGCYTMV